MKSPGGTLGILIPIAKVLQIDLNCGGWGDSAKPQKLFFLCISAQVIILCCQCESHCSRDKVYTSSEMHNVVRIARQQQQQQQNQHNFGSVHCVFC